MRQKISSHAKSYNPMFGARPMKRYLQKYVETELGRALLKGDVVDDDNVEYT